MRYGICTGMENAGLLKALGYAGLGKNDASRAAVGELSAVDPWNPKLSFLQQLGVLE